ncbi:hypothetical protein EDD15DRAFT_2176074 [Pisolithus albus]|nr:hypothetical protein EDD15DRAFT_2176074 [Pisolithus albus]
METCIVSVCASCLTELKQQKEGPPRHSLANNLWIGDIPWELKTLTFPEQLLIALAYPCVFVFKLFPKRIQGNRDVTTLQRAMRGNVTSYELDMEGISSMIEGKLMPRPPVILASLIAVSFIGVGDLPKHWIRSMFRVRRQAVCNALLWLKRNNPKYYGNIEISDERLQTLPQDDVPTEISGVIRQSEDVGVTEGILMRCCC